MIIERLKLENIRGIKKLDIDFDPNLTIIIGKNGAGKTTILDMLSIMLAHAKNIWLGEGGDARGNFPHISGEDAKQGSNNYSVSIELANLNDINSEPVIIKLSSEDRGKLSDSSKAIIRMPKLESSSQPLFAYYKQDRAFESSHHTSEDLSRQSVLDNSLSGNFKAITNLQKWWDKRDAQEARRVRDKNLEYRDPQLESIRSLIKAIGSFKGVSYEATETPEGLYFEKNTGAKVHINNLSTGERSYITLLADLARRLQTTAPKKELSSISAIILIDEIELNLHPLWQGKIIGSLTSIFSSCQFVMTTHSPQVLSGANSKNIRIINQNEMGDIVVDTPLSTKGRSSNYLLEGVFGASERYPPIDEMIEKFNRLISERKSAEAKALLELIAYEIEGSPPELIVLKKRLKNLDNEK